MFAIEASGLEKSYAALWGRRGQVALRGVDLSISEGTAFGLIGLNGAGKTTFIKLVLSILRPTRGTVRVLGASPEDPSTRAQIGYLPEQLHLPPKRTPGQILASVARLKGHTLHATEALSLLQRVGLTAEAHRRVGTFSKGMRQRLGLAMALLGKPKLLVLDEPTDGVDPLGRVEFRQILTEELSRGATIFLNSHLLAETERVCHRIGVLVSGRVVREGSIDELCRSETRWLARFAADSPLAAISKAGFVPGEKPGVWVMDGVDASTLNDKLHEARQVGALVTELTRDFRSLEQVLADAVRLSS